MKTFNINLTASEMTEATYINLYNEDTNRGWALRNLVSRLYQAKSLELTKDEQGIMAYDMMLEAEELTNGEPVNININSHLKAIRNLEVPTINKQQFQLRSFIKPQHLESVIKSVWQRTGGEENIDWLLTPQRRDQICQMALLDPKSLDQNISDMLKYQNCNISEGTTSGTYGRFLIIN